ncbi:hypothetical protein VIGAN_04062200, partial [Vigna angularis var. angularis]
PQSLDSFSPNPTPSPRHLFTNLHSRFSPSASMYSLFFQSYSFPTPFIHVFWTSNRVWSIRARSMARRRFLSPPFWVQIMGSSVGFSLFAFSSSH